MHVQEWIKQHPYLESIAQFETLIEQAIDNAWRAGSTPALSADAQHAAAGDVLRQVSETLARLPLPDAVAPAIIEFRALAAASPAHAVNAIEWALNGDEQDYAPVIRLLAWHVLRRFLKQMTPDSSWQQPECPTCGAPPLLAQLVPDGGGRRRILACALCQTTWQYKRVGCPFCENESPSTLASFQIEGDDDHRLDVCDVCRGYTKTYLGTADPSAFLADWPTLHLDLIARDRGYQRLGASLYEI